ncbi:hypothetical protein K7X08_021409 [Anisodus acutangulus]|uniref:Uncharacterized protein n=1 Tax=Anisodus acutangulus TaxID=402998 RepID=A0A9Q1M0I7_9SOLA|nr:hypothetical protein K7X08_021409 [Anisodus acutangulus]
MNGNRLAQELEPSRGRPKPKYLDPAIADPFEGGAEQQAGKAGEEIWIAPKAMPFAPKQELLSPLTFLYGVSSSDS